MTSQRRLGLLFVLVGPPGAGKNTLMNAVLDRVDNLRQLPTATTRPPRPNERQGREHIFVSRAEFQKMVEAQALVERYGQEVHGELYGMPKAAIEEAIANEQDLIADIDVLGATYLRTIYPDNAVLIFIQPSSIEDLKRRMQNRGETEAEIEKRMQRVSMEMQYAPLCDYLITNDDDRLQEAGEILYAIILAERSHRALLNLRAAQELPRRKFTYVTTAVPFCGDEVLYRSTPPHFPTVPIAHGEFPHDAALRALQQDFRLNALADNLYPPGIEKVWPENSLITPLSLDNHAEAHHHQITFFYLYHLPERIAPPQDWQWVSYETVQLPEAVLTVLRAQGRSAQAHRNVESSHEPA